MSKPMLKRLRARKHPAAAAWDDWIDNTEQGVSARDVTTLKAPSDQRQYLENRLYHAFMAGYRAAEVALRRPVQPGCSE
jgi:hypothetical protein